MSGRRCPICGKGKLTTAYEARKYGRGINVTLVNVPVRRCAECGEEFLTIPAIEELHRLIAHDLARAAGRLKPGEIRFLRTYLGYSSIDFARAIGVTPETVSRWESERNPKPMAAPAERLLRLMALEGRPIESYGLDRTDRDAPRAEISLRLKPTAEGWAAA